MSLNFFSYDTYEGFERWETKEEAEGSAKKALDQYKDYKDRARGEEWDEEVLSICWGPINQSVKQVSLKTYEEQYAEEIEEAEKENNHDDLPPHFDFFCDYDLKDVNFYINNPNVKNDLAAIVFLLFLLLILIGTIWGLVI